MRADGTARLGLAAAAGICAALAGCASGAGAQAPGGGAVTATQQAGSQRDRHASPRGSAADTAARTGTPTARTGTPTARTPPAVRRKVSAMLASGLYTDGPDGTPHYTLSFTPGRGGVLSGSVSFLYQDGRISTAGSYVAALSRSGKITLTLDDGKALSGIYTAGHLNLAGCAAALPLAKFADGCAFTYHGHVP